MCEHRFERSMRDDSGATAVLFAVMIVVLLGLGAFFIDAGALYSERRSLQGAADAGALAGVQELPSSPGNAVAVANSYGSENAANLGVAAPVVSSRLIAADTVECVVRDPEIQLMFARFLNHSTARVGATAVAKIQSPTVFGPGVMPFGIMSADPSGTAPFGYPFGTPVRLKQPAQSGEAGNFQFLSLTDPPGGHFGNNDITGALSGGGVPNPVYLGGIYNTKTGINGRTVSRSLADHIRGDSHSFNQVAVQRPDGLVELLDPDCPRLIVCPIIMYPGPPPSYNWTEVNGSKPIKVIGFAYFFIERVGSVGNDCYVDGRFVRPIGPDDQILGWGPVDPLGAVGYRLVE